MSDCEKLLDYLKKHKRITSFTAFRELGNTRVGARVYDLRQQGYNISTKMVYGKKRDGSPTHWAVYTLEE